VLSNEPKMNIVRCP